MSYVIIRTDKGSNYNWKNDRHDHIVFGLASKKKAEAKLMESRQRLKLTTKLWREIEQELSQWEQANRPPKGRPMREDWTEWRVKHYSLRDEKCASAERENNLPEGWMLETMNALEYRIEEVEDL
jgi:hypothetical protein